MANTVTVLLNSVRDIVFDVADNSGKIHYVKINGSVEKTYGSMSIFKKGYIKATTPKTEKAAREELSTKENGEEPEATQESGKKRGRRKASN